MCISLQGYYITKDFELVCLCSKLMDERTIYCWLTLSALSQSDSSIENIFYGTNRSLSLNALGCKTPKGTKRVGNKK